LIDLTIRFTCVIVRVNLLENLHFAQCKKVNAWGLQQMCVTWLCNVNYTRICLRASGVQIKTIGSGQQIKLRHTESALFLQMIYFVELKITHVHFLHNCISFFKAYNLKKWSALLCNGDVSDDVPFSCSTWLRSQDQRLFSAKGFHVVSCTLWAGIKIFLIKLYIRVSKKWNCIFLSARIALPQRCTRRKAII
jgi:hypothetical protein